MQGEARSMSNAPQVAGSTEEERRAYVKERFPCIADCDPETAYADYIAGKAEFLEVSLRYQR